MIKRTNTSQATLDFDFTLCPHLSRHNRWVHLADLIPWKELSAIYEESLSKDKGAPTIPSRIVIGALIIKHLKNLSDEETIEDIRENPYYQYFLGYSSFRDRQVFAPSLFVEIRKRLGPEKLTRINETFLKLTESKDDELDLPDRGGSTAKDSEHDHHGMLIMDATVAPQDITYPTDVGLLNKAREKLEAIIDELWQAKPGDIKPRTYRRQARKQYLTFSRKRNPRKKTIRKALRKQLSYVRRDLNHINRMLDSYTGAFPLSSVQQRHLWIITELFRQQEIMYKTGTHSIPDRIVSIAQPHVRPIVRGKAKAKTEFGAKISASIVDGKVYLDRLSWDAYNESEDLREAVERYKKRFGYYPESVNADKIYWNRDNRNYLKKRGIAMYGGSPLGRPSQTRTREEKRHHKQESIKRNRIEGVFGLSKRRYGLERVMAKTRKTSESWIAMVIFIINVAGVCRDKILALFFPIHQVREVGFCSIFHNIPIKLIKMLMFGRGKKWLNQLQNVSVFSIPAF